MLGKEAVEEMEVVAVDPQRRTEIHAEHGGTRYLSGVELLPAGNGPAGPGECAATLLRFRFSAEQARAATGLAGRVRRTLGAVTAPLGIAATRSAVRTELAAIAEVAERRAAVG